MSDAAAADVSTVHPVSPHAPGAVLREPGPDALAITSLGRYVRWLAEERGLEFVDHEALWRWSVDDLEGFWASVWDHFAVRAHTPYERVLASREMPGARWFPGATLNYAEHMLGLEEDRDRTAVIARSQTRGSSELTFGELRDQVARAREGLRRLGVGAGDRVVAYLPNIPEALVAFLATASLGAVWASCAPEFGARSVVDRFAQIEPTVLLTVAGYTYGDKDIDKRDEVAAIRAGLPSVEHVVAVPYGPHAVGDGARAWGELVGGTGPLVFEPVPFDHPLYVLFSCGTTGLPKVIVHGHGGILLEHLKLHALNLDTRPGDRALWFTTTAWAMWNITVSALLHRAAIVLLDGNPLWPDLDAQWRLAAETGATLMGTSPGFLMACRKDGVRPAGWPQLRQIGITGAPLPAEGFDWVYERFGPDVLLNPISGGTDVCSAFVGGGPWLPVYRGELAAPCLGADVTAFNAAGREAVGELGELVVRAPMPSMPVRFWNDPGDARYRSSYFETFPGVWRHGDWVEFTGRGSCVISGRSDATLNRGGVRLGTAEFYAVVEELPEIADSLVVHLEDAGGGPGRLLLFVALRDGTALDDALGGRIRDALRSQLSPRHVPDAVHVVPAIPRTLTGKKLETPIKQILRGRAAAEVVSPDAVSDFAAVAAFAALVPSRDATREG
ncbi:acetoacetate--CoA ligase [Pseudonocardia sp. H11422]|uniref:acetoacetate--CoA ligase n=1 Tax=Pseudonocardia sp. H11422 TaxID=2835866 RepID=UPI001BDD535A|nr:acetoacetate--CoA ligase [Pseudonocardia sp. H11422]